MNIKQANPRAHTQILLTQTISNINILEKKTVSHTANNAIIPMPLAVNVNIT